MKNSIYLIAVAMLFIFGCQSESPNSSTMRVNDPNFPTDAGGGDAVFDIPTPSMTGAEQGDAIGDNYPVQVCWTYTVEDDDYYTNTVWYPQGNHPARPYGYVPTATLNPGAENSPYEFWGGSQQTIVVTNNGGNPAYSGHYELYRQVDGGSWEKLLDTRDLCYTDDNDGAGWPIGTVLSYKVKEKSLEGSTPNDVTHHSLESEGITITIEEPCYEIELDDTYAININAGTGGNGSWNATGTVWTANSSATNQNMNMFYNIYAWTNTENSCTGEITSTPIQGGYTGNMYLSRDGGTTWRLSLPWNSIDGFHHNSTYPGGNGSGLGKFTAGNHTILWSVNGVTATGSFTLVMPN